MRNHVRNSRCRSIQVATAVRRNRTGRPFVCSSSAWNAKDRQGARGNHWLSALELVGTSSTARFSPSPAAPSALPDVYRALTLNNLCALIPYHPEMVGNFQIENGMPCPFIMTHDDRGEAVLLFSSEARADEAVKTGRFPESKYTTAAMPARQMLEIIGKMELRAIINPACATGTFEAPPDMMRDLASGVALQPLPSGPIVERIFNVIDPADYPTDLIQPLFEVSRRDWRYRAAWVMRGKEPAAAGGTSYAFFVWIDPPDAALVHDCNIVLQNSRNETDEASITVLDEQRRRDLDLLFSQTAPFHKAPDFDDVDLA
jgi:hypothetical protein